MAEPDPVPGWTRCPTCSSPLWRQWTEPELRLIVREARRAEGGLTQLADKLGISARTLQRFERREAVDELTVLRIALYLQQQHHIAPMRLQGLGSGRPLRPVFGTFRP